MTPLIAPKPIANRTVGPVFGYDFTEGELAGPSTRAPIPFQRPGALASHGVSPGCVISAKQSFGIGARAGETSTYVGRSNGVRRLRSSVRILRPIRQLYDVGKAQTQTTEVVGEGAEGSRLLIVCGEAGRQTPMVEPEPVAVRLEFRHLCKAHFVEDGAKQTRRAQHPQLRLDLFRVKLELMIAPLSVRSVDRDALRLDQNVELWPRTPPSPTSSTGAQFPPRQGSTRTETNVTERARRHSLAAGARSARDSDRRSTLLVCSPTLKSTVAGRLQ